MTQDTRKDPRAKIVSLNVRYKSATVDEFIENHSYDVSKGGVFIKTPNAFPPGTLLKFEIRIAGDKAVIVGVGRVVWKREASQGGGPERPAGMGVKFIKIDDPSRQLIDKLVATKADAGRAYEIEAPPDETPTVEAGHATARGIGAAKPLTPPTPMSAAERRQTVIGVGGVNALPGFDPAAAAAAAAAAGLQTGANDEDLPATVQRETARVGTVPVGVAARDPAKKVARGTLIGVAPDLSAAPPARGAGATSLPTPVTPPASPAYSAAAPSIAERAAARELTREAPKPVAGMFAKAEAKAEPAAPNKEPTVMKQAAELLEEALKEAGGSMEEIGQNPLFSHPTERGAKRSDAPPAAPAKDERPSARAPHGMSRDPASASAIAKSVRSTPEPTPKASSPDRAAPAAPAHSERPRPASQRPAAGVPAVAQPRPPAAKPAAPAVAAILIEPPRKSNTGLILGGVLVVAAVGFALIYKTSIAGDATSQPQVGNVAPTPPPPTVAPEPSVAPPAALAASAAASGSVTTLTTDSGASAATTTADAGTKTDAAAKPEAAATKLAPPTPAATPAATPVPTPKPAPKPTVERAPPPSRPPPSEVKPPSDEAPAPAPKPKPKPPKPPVEDTDNPY